jgi:hypothetical protein
MRDEKHWAARVEYVLANEGGAFNHIARPANAQAQRPAASIASCRTAGA